MDSRTFDTWARNRALRLTRRDALEAIGIAGVATLLPQVRHGAAAQGTCTLTLHAETAAGPSAPLAYDGVLEFSLGVDGAFTQATFTPTSGAPQSVSGIATGRALDFQIDLPGSQTISFSGSSTQPLDLCQGSAGGLFSGPQPGDLGGWQLASTAAGAAGGSTQGQPAPSSCAPGQTLCGGVCYASCATGQQFDTGSCTCFTPQPTCLPNGSQCESGYDCCGGSCSPDSICQTCAGLVCGDIGCIDQSSDPFNCGSCGHVCGSSSSFCFGGVCQCIPDGAPGAGPSDGFGCCAGVADPNGICGCVPLGGWCEFTGSCCGTDAGVICTYVLSGFKQCCLSNDHGCASNDQCCSQLCSNGVCANPA